MERVLARDAAGAELRVVGRVRPRSREALRAPITGRPCVAFQVSIDESDGEGWAERLSLREAQSFVVVDESGRALVDADGPFELALVTDRQASSGLLGMMTSDELQAARSYLS